MLEYQNKIERRNELVILAQLFDLVFDALYLIDIEPDKIPSELKSQLRTVLKELSDRHQLQPIKYQPGVSKISVRKNDLAALQEAVSEKTKENFLGAGLEQIIATTEFTRLLEVISIIVAREKDNRDQEEQYRQENHGH